jgi:nucleotide-binding universal stress UspA family protein
LTEHGVKAAGDHLVFDPSSIEPAERLMSYLAETGADLLVIGAAGQQLGRSAAKRSLTRHVLTRMTVPVLLSF